MFCKGCGKEVADGAVTCPNCGTALQEPVIVQTGNVVNSPYPGIIGNVSPDYVLGRGIWAVIFVPVLIPALILGSKAIKGAKTYEDFGNPKNAKVTVGKILGIVARFLCVLPFIAILVMFIILIISGVAQSF